MGVGVRASAGPRLRAAWATGDGGLGGKTGGVRRRPVLGRWGAPEDGRVGTPPLETRGRGGVARWG